MNAISDRELWTARVIDREVAPIWHDRFARLIMRGLPTTSDAFALDVHCGIGRTTAELLQRLDDSSRVIALEPDEAALALAKSRVRPAWRNRVYFKHGDVGQVTEMADDAYDIVVANLALGEAHDFGSILAELLRVTKPGGEILATVALRGTWQEPEDILAEVLVEAGALDARDRLGRLIELRPTGTELYDRVVNRLGVAADDVVVEQERFTMLFPSGREFLFAPVIEHGPLKLWKAMLGANDKPQEVFWRLKESIDTYYSGQAFSVTIRAGLLHVRRAGSREPLAVEFFRRHPGLEEVFRGAAAAPERGLETETPTWPAPVPSIAPQASTEPVQPPAAEHDHPFSDFELDVEVDLGEEPARDPEPAPVPDLEAGRDPAPVPEPAPVAVPTLEPLRARKATVVPGPLVPPPPVVSVPSPAPTPAAKPVAPAAALAETADEPRIPEELLPADGFDGAEPLADFDAFDALDALREPLAEAEELDDTDLDSLLDEVFGAEGDEAARPGQTRFEPPRPKSAPPPPPGKKR